VDGAYNERREACEKAARYFATVLDHPVRALRDVSWAELGRATASRLAAPDESVVRLGGTRKPYLDDLTARRAAHPIGENERVLAGVECLKNGDAEAFGRLMYESHESSRKYFENSCPELDVLVDASCAVPGVFGARLTGGGFGGSVVVMTTPIEVEGVSEALRNVYARKFGERCDTRVVVCSEGAGVVCG